MELVTDRARAKMSEEMRKCKLKPEIAILTTAICVCAVITVILPFGTAQQPLHDNRELNSNITVVVEDTIVHYQKQSFWTEREFKAILEDKEEYKTVVINDLAEKIAKYGERGEYAAGTEVEFDEPRKATVLRCDIHDAVTKSDDRYRATFIWLLKPLGLDFIDDKFKEYNDGLLWKGELSGIPTSITVAVPLQESVYKAWQRPVGHCHGHVWWTISAVPSLSPVLTPSSSPGPASSGFNVIFAITGILAVGYLMLRKKKHTLITQ